MGEQTRATMLDAMMDGRAHTATELAVQSDVTPQTASFHLAQLVDSGLVEVIKQGRHRYFRLASPKVAAVLEGLMGLGNGTALERGPRDPRLRRARVCYDHLAGEVAVAAFARMRTQGFIDGRDFDFALTAAGDAWCRKLGIAVHAVRKTKRPLCRACLDWSERRPHLAGHLGAALFLYLTERSLASRVLDSRAVTLTAAGERFLRTLEPAAARG